MDKENHLLYRRIIGMTFLSTITLLVYFLVNDYYTSFDSAKNLASQNLQGVVDDLAKRIDGNPLDSLAHQLETKVIDHRRSQNEHFQKIQKLLELTQTAHGIDGHIYTFIKSDRSDSALVIVATGGDSINLGQKQVSSSRELYNELNQDPSINLYKNDNAYWLSAFAPVKNSKGESVAYVKARDRFDPVISQLRAVAYKNAALCFIGLALISLLLFPYVRQILQRDEHLRKRLKQQTKENQRLKTTLEKKEQQIEKYATELEFSNEELNNFARIASHELKAPMRTIHSFAQLIKKRQGARADENILEYLDLIIKDAHRGTHLIDSLLNYSNVEKNLGERKQFDISQSVLQAQHVLHSEIPEKEADIRFDRLPVILANPTLITQVFQNLINNAIKYNQADKPLVEIGNNKRDANTYLFYVKDNGIGIAPEHHQKVFNIFTRLHSVAKYEGSGIGLALCKKVIASYGGEIWLESSEGSGTTVYFTLPKSMIIKAPLVHHAMSL